MRPERAMVDAARGAVAGAVATVAMTALMEAGQRAGLLGEMPPRRVAEKAEQALGVAPPAPATDALASVLHVAIGAAAGAAYALGRAATGHRGAAPLAGSLFGALFWAVSYVGVIPALNILPRPSRDRPGRPPVMLAAHVVFGAALGVLVDRFDPAA